MNDRIEVLTSEVLAECRRACRLFGTDHPADVAEVEAEAFRILADPESVTPFTPDELSQARADMLAVAQSRGIDLDAARAEIDAFIMNVTEAQTR